VSKVLIPVLSYGFDPTEVAMPWKLVKEKNNDVVFAVSTGRKASPDRLMVSGDRLAVCKPALRAGRDAVTACADMQQDDSFLNW
jgi:protease I